jgi:hypothetical protein
LCVVPPESKADAEVVEGSQSWCRGCQKLAWKLLTLTAGALSLMFKALSPLSLTTRALSPMLKALSSLSLIAGTFPLYSLLLRRSSLINDYLVAYWYATVCCCMLLGYARGYKYSRVVGYTTVQ